MKGKHFFEKRPDSILEWMCLIFASIAFYLFLSNLGYFMGGFYALLGILSPFAGGVVIAFVLNPMVKYFHQSFLHEVPRLRWVAILMSYVVAILLLVIVPVLIVEGQRTEPFSRFVTVVYLLILAVYIAVFLKFGIQFWKRMNAK